MFLKPSTLPARTLASIAVASVAAVVFALIAQHGFGVKPCAWCVFQRGIFLIIAAVAALGWLTKSSAGARKAALLLILLTAIGGIAAAVFQHEVAANMESCAMTLADQTITALNLEERLPYVFMVTASCAQAAAYRLLGLPYEVWSGLVFAVMALASALALRKR
jgi:disulfide bond formation protein DsbB